MKKILKSIVTFFKSIFGQDINVSIENNSKYNMKNNKNCNISINDSGDSNDKK